MPITNVHAPSYASVAALARAGAAGVAQRENVGDALRLAQNDQHFGAQLQQRANEQAYGYADQRAREAAHIQSQLVAGQQAMQELNTKNEIDRSNVDWKYTKEQEQKKKRYEADLSVADELRASGEYDDHQHRSAVYQIQQKMMGIKPTPTPKLNPLDQYAKVPGANGKMFHVVPGRNGVPQYVPADPEEADPKVVAKKDTENAKLLQAEKAAARKQFESDRAHRLDMEKLANTRFEKLLAQQTPEGLPKFTPEQAAEFAGLTEFLPQKKSGTLELLTGMANKAVNGVMAPSPAAPIRLTPDAAGHAAYQSLPSGASYIAPDGSTRTKK